MLMPTPRLGLICIFFLPILFALLFSYALQIYLRILLFRFTHFASSLTHFVFFLHTVLGLAKDSWTNSTSLKALAHLESLISAEA